MCTTISRCVVLSLVLVVCFGKTVLGHSVTVQLQLSTPPTSYDCIGGEVGLTNTSILLQYKTVQQQDALNSSFDANTTLQQWTDVAATNLSAPSPVSLTLGLDSSVQGLQFRLLQLEHGGGSCNCWALDSMAITLASQAQVWLEAGDICLMSGDQLGQGLGTFCDGGAGEARGSITRVFHFLGSSGSRCASGSQTLIDTQEPSLPDDCSMVVPRL